MFTFPI